MTTPCNNLVILVSYEEQDFRLPKHGTKLMSSTILPSGKIWGSQSSGYKESYIVGYNAVYPVENQPMFRRNLSPASSGAKNKTSK
jgi:hypothetical protein